MLRITANDSPRVLNFRLEGRLEGPWVRELEQCWRDTLHSPSRPSVCVDLTGVTFIDAAGKAGLAQMHQQGAEFIAGDCATKAVVAEILELRNGSLVCERKTQHDTGASEPTATDQRSRGPI